MTFKEENPNAEDWNVGTPNKPIDVDELATSALSPDEALAEKESAEPDYGYIEEKTRQMEVEERDADPTPEAWKTHPAMDGVPYVEQTLGSEISDRGAAEEEELDRKGLLEQLREWWNKDQNVARNPATFRRKVGPKAPRRFAAPTGPRPTTGLSIKWTRRRSRASGQRKNPPAGIFSLATGSGSRPYLPEPEPASDSAAAR